MKNKLSMVLGIAALAFLFAVTPVMAATTVEDTSENNTIGADAVVTNNANVDVNLDVDKDVDVDLDNDADVDLDTDVDQNENVGDGEVNLEEVDLTADWTNTVDPLAGWMASEEGDINVDSEKTNDTIGADAVATNNLDFDFDLNVDLDLDVDFDNDLDVSVDRNVDQNKNVGEQSIEDEGISLMADFMNEVWGGGLAGAAAHGSTSYNGEMTNENVGAGAVVTNNDNIDVDYNYDIDVDYDFNNDVDFNVERDVKQNKNVGGQSVNLKPVKAEVSISNIAGGSSSSAATGGDVDVTSEKTNDTIGADAVATNNLDFDYSVDVDVDKDVDVENNVDVDVDDDVEQNRNVGNGEVNVGGATINLTIENNV